MILDAFEPPVELRPEPAVLLPDRGTLVVADVHLGKSAAFRARGLAVPEGDTRRDLERLTTLIEATGARRLVVAGDLFHSPAGLTPEVLTRVEDWLRSTALPVTLVLGNHDRRLTRFPDRLETVARVDLGGLQVVHDPVDADAGRATLCGHLHPVVRVADGKRTSLRLPCFHLSRRHLVLPAFGSFTGGSIVDPERGDRIFVAPADTVVEVPPGLWG